MAKSFAITTSATETLKADKGHAQAVYTVTNSSARPIRGLARARALGDTKTEWLKIDGETERDFGGGATEQFTVNFDAPNAPAGKYSFRLDVASRNNPDEDFTEGQTVNVEIAAPPPPPPPKKKFPLWIIFVIIGAVVLIGVVVLIIVLATGKNENANEEPSPTPVEASPTPAESTPTPGATATPTPTPPGNEFRVTGAKLVARPDQVTGRCPVVITFTGSISVNGAGTVSYTFLRSDGAIDTNKRVLRFNGPGSQTVETTWTLGAPIPAFQPFKGFQQIKILEPNDLVSDRAAFVLNCTK